MANVSKRTILGSESIQLGFQITGSIIRNVLHTISASNYVLITDTHLAPLYLDTYIESFVAISNELFHENPPRLLTRVLPPDKFAKHRQIKADIRDWLLSNAITRDTCFLAMGGSGIGELVGSVAANVMRDAHFVQIPTTLLAMIDLSTSGKTAINTPGSKGPIGVFWQPKRIFIDLAFLHTLPEREFANGMAEVIKTADIWREPEFVKLEQGVAAIRDAVLHKKVFANFANNVLRPMGCSVKQTGTTTTVTGPTVGQLCPLDSVGLENMRDAFSIAGVLAVMASGPHENNMTNITSTTSQWKKEYSRVTDMIDELKKLGITTTELGDGIQIHKRAIVDLKTPEEGVCNHDDYRAAMDTSVLAGVVSNGNTTQEKKHILNAEPTRWNGLHDEMAVPVSDIDPGKKEEPVKHIVCNIPSQKAHHACQDKSIIIVGMRGAGKTSLGRYAAAILGFKFVDMDHQFEKVHNTSVFDFVKIWGWKTFRTEETKVLKTFLANPEHGHRTIIACGGGVIETQEAREILNAYCCAGGKVIHLVRKLEQVISYLSKDETRPMHGEDMRSVWERRRAWYQQVSNFEFVAHSECLSTDGCLVPCDWRNVKHDFQRLLLFITGRNTNHVNLSRGHQSIPTTAVSLAVKQISGAITTLRTVCEGADAIELRVDLLKPGEDDNAGSFIEYVGEQLAIIRRISSLPVIFTVRSKAQGGTFADDDEHGMFELLQWGLRWGCEYIDVETCWTPSVIEKFVAGKGESLIIASWHDVRLETPWGSSALEAKYDMADKLGDIIKLVGVAETMQDNIALETFRASKRIGKALIAVNMGSVGQLSHVLNEHLTPTTHSMLPVKTALGQLSLVETSQAHHLLGYIPARKIWVLGAPIKHSMSPTLHNTGFEALGLPYQCDLLECHAIERAEDALLRDPLFGGASVTIPHKVAVMKYLDIVSEKARLIGSVNTISVVYEKDVNGKTTRRLVGDNTDCAGILRCIQPLMVDPFKCPEHGLVLGCGGTARAALYALYQLGIQKIFLWNRTIGKAYELQTAFKELVAIQVVESLECDMQPDVIVSTVPADSGIELPEHVYGDKKGILCDVAYKPRRTRLLLQAKHKGWDCVEGIQVLVEQGLAQFEIWTGKHPPAQRMREQVLKKYDL